METLIDTADTSETGRPIGLETTYAALPERFYAPVPPNAVTAPRLIRLNRPLAEELGLDPDWLAGADGVAMLAGNRYPPDARPIALAYAGHQFGNFVPQLGDGRALLVGEVVDRLGHRRDIHLKGSGPTRFSRAADGRAALGPVLREFIVSEAMAALGIPTSRTLAAVATGEPVYRERIQQGAVLARVAASHIRIGTFQFFAARRDVDGLRLLMDHAMARHYPELAQAHQPALAFLEAVVAAQADLVARWMLVGFIHGVMNTDNMTVSGETIDYGPCAFMDAYDPGTVFSSIDRGGRYAFANQPGIAVWNLARLAEALLPLIDEDVDKAVAAAEQALRGFQAHYDRAFHAGLRRKIGLMTERDEDLPLITGLFEAMAAAGADFTLTFRRLADAINRDADAAGLRGLFPQPDLLDAWLERWRERVSTEGGDVGERRRVMLAANPKFIPRNHRVEAALAAADEGDLSLFDELMGVLSRPFDEQPAFDRYAEPPRPEERVLATFCGT